MVYGITVAWALPTRIHTLFRLAGEGGSCPLCCISASHPHPNLPPLDGGRDQVAVAERGRLKPYLKLSDDLFAFDTLNLLSPQYSRIRGQSPRYAVGQCLKFGKPIAGVVVLVYGITVAWALPTRIRSLSRLAGEGWGEGGSFLLYCISANHPHPSLPCRTGGRDQVAVTEKGRLKNLFRAFQTTFHLYFKHYLNQLLLLQLILQIRIINRRDNDAADAENPFEHDHRHQQFPRA